MAASSLLRVGLSGLLSLSACTSATEISFDAPAGVEAWAAIVERSDGSTSGSVLGPLPTAVSAPESGHVFLYGFEADAIEEQDLGQTVQVAATCDAKLGDASFVAELVHGELRELDPSDRPPLTTTRLASACDSADLGPRGELLDPSLVSALSIEQDCDFTPCPGVVTVDGCRVTVDLAECGIGRAALTTGGANARGEVCFEDGSSCRASPPERGALFSWACTDPDVTQECHAHLQSAARTPDETPFSIERVELLPGAEVQNLIRLNSSDLNRLSPGTIPIPVYIAGLLRLSSSIVVAVHPTPRLTRDCLGDPIELYFLDPDSLATVRTATAPSCIDQMIPDPVGDGFIAAFGMAFTHYLGRFDAEGRLVAETALPLNLEDPPPKTRAYRSVILLDAPTTEELVVGLEALFTSEVERQYFVANYDLEVGAAELRRCMRPRCDPGAGALVGAVWPTSDQGQLIGLVDDEVVRQISWLDQGGEESVTSLTNLRIGSRVLQNTRDYRGLYPLGDARGLVIAGGPAPGFVLARFGETDGAEALAAVYEADAEPTTLAPWSEGIGLTALRDADSEGAGDVLLALVDLETPRLLPGMTRLGRDLGIARHATPDRGCVLLSLPWIGQVARVCPNR